MPFYFLYIDPSSGSYLVQIIIAGILGSLFFFKNLWVKIKSFFIRKNKIEEDKTENEL